MLRNSHSNFGLNTISRITSIAAFKKSNYFLSVSEDGYLIKWSIDDPNFSEELYLNISKDGMEQEYVLGEPQPKSTYLRSVGVSPSEEYAIVGSWDGVIRVSSQRKKADFNLTLGDRHSKNEAGQIYQGGWKTHHLYKIQ